MRKEIILFAPRNQETRVSPRKYHKRYGDRNSNHDGQPIHQIGSDETDNELICEEYPMARSMCQWKCIVEFEVRICN